MAETEDLASRDVSGQNALNLRLLGTGRAPTLTLARTENDATSANGAETSVVTEKIALTGKLNPATAFSAQGQRTTTDRDGDENDQTRIDASASVATALTSKAATATIAVKSNLTDTSGGAMNAEHNIAVQVKAKPTAALSLSAEQTTRLSESAQGDKRDRKHVTQQAASAELKPFQNTRIAGTFARTADVTGDTRTDRLELRAETKPLRYLDLSGGMIARDDTRRDGAELETQQVRLTLRPLSGWSLTGGLVVNPESNGTVADALRHEVGLNGRLGALEFGGGYALLTPDEEATASTAGNPSGELDLRLGLRFSRATQLTSTFRDRFVYGAAAPIGLRTYGLGLTHNLGSTSFSFGGTMTEDKAKVGLPADVKAEAKLGLKF
jgi:hypothetical protein